MPSRRAVEDNASRRERAWHRRLLNSRIEMICSTLNVLTSGLIQKRFRKRGRKANPDRSRSIANVVSQHDRRWSNGSTLWKSDFLLTHICRELDRANVLVPANWPAGRSPSLFLHGVDAGRWEEALDMGFKALVTNQLRYHLSRCLHTP
jgi:hypothetical protein